VSLIYNYTVDDEVLRLFISLPRRRREELLRIFDQLAADAFQQGDSLQPDDTGRDCQVKRFGFWVVTWWAEHLANQVHIIAVDRLQ